MLIGVDFDNTIACYDLLFHRRALAAGLIEADLPKTKASVRRQVQERHGDLAWQRLQGEVYGPRMQEARLIPGVLEFFRRCRREGIEVRIVSHKTPFGHFDATRTSLPGAALRWMERNRFFETEQTGLTPQMVHFEPTRAAKIARIDRLGCTHFIDDLPEVLLDAEFPPQVDKILLSAEAVPATPQLTRCPDWQAIAALFFDRDDREDAGWNWQALAGLPGATVQPLGGGKNSQVVRIVAADGTSLVGKRYFRHPGDPRDRLGTEMAALELMAGQGIKGVPRVVLCDRQAGAALLEDLGGGQVAHPSTAEVEALVRWLLALQTPSVRQAAADLPPASEAFFSGEEISANLAERLQRLLQPAPDSPVRARMQAFLLEEVAPCMERAKSDGRTALEEAEMGWSAPLPCGERILSPSDFGFHNARRLGEGHLALCDFEYFGWDDPAKTICDFVLHRHPLMQLAEEHRSTFVGKLLAALPEADRLKARCAAYYRLFRLKWCLIMLNGFLPVAGARRRFAGDALASDSAQLARRLDDVRTFFHATERDYERFNRHLA